VACRTFHQFNKVNSNGQEGYAVLRALWHLA